MVTEGDGIEVLGEGCGQPKAPYALSGGIDGTDETRRPRDEAGDRHWDFREVPGNILPILKGLVNDRWKSDATGGGLLH